MNEINLVLKTCALNSSTIINSTGFTIGSPLDETVLELYLDDNTKVKFLPHDIGGKFPNLESISAWLCGLEAISKENFQELSKLRRLAINGNKIREISADTFEDLPLEWLFLDNNMIQTLDVKLFEGLNRLQIVTLSANLCVDKDFHGEIQIAEMSKVITEKCAIRESSPSLDETRNSEKEK